MVHSCLSGVKMSLATADVCALAIGACAWAAAAHLAGVSEIICCVGVCLASQKVSGSILGAFEG